MKFYYGMRHSSSILISTTSTHCAVPPDTPELIRPLAKESTLLTVATEAMFVTHCTVKPNLTWIQLLAELRTFLGTDD